MEQIRRGSWQVAVDAALTAAMYVAVFGLLFGSALQVPVSARIWALSGSTCFVLVAATAAWRVKHRSAWFMLAGLIACWLGDYLGPIHFQAGAASFLLAHLLFIGAWTRTGVNGRAIAATLGAVLVVSLAIGVWLLPAVPRGDLLLVLAYMSVISLMVAVAGGVDKSIRSITLLGAVLFYVSDIAVARGKYVSPGIENSWMCYPLYYTACLLFAFWAWRLPHAVASLSCPSGDRGGAQ